MKVNPMNEEMDRYYNEYYKQHIVTALIGVKCSTKNLDMVSRSLVNYNNVEDVFLTTGEYDIIIKVKFPDYSLLKNFIISELSKLQGISKTETMLVINSYKERGIKFEGGEENG